MKLKEIVEKFSLKVRCNTDNLDVEVNNGYVSDLLSDVLANSEDLPTNKETRAGSNRTLKRKIQNYLGNRAIKVYKGN